MTFWDVVCAVIVGNAFYVVVGVALDQIIAWLSKPRYKHSRKGGTAKEVQMAYDKAISDDREPYLGWAGTTDYEEPHDCLLAGCLDNENEEPCPNA